MKTFGDPDFASSGSAKLEQQDVDDRDSMIEQSFSSPADHRDDASHDSAASTGASSAEHDRLHGLVSYHNARCSKLEAENTTLKVELANVRFDLEQSKLKLRKMMTKNEALQKELLESMKSKAEMAQTLGSENSEMISTIDKLGSERDALKEEVDKLKGWIVNNKGEGDEIIVEEAGIWAAGSSRSIGGTPRSATKPQINTPLLSPRFSNKQQIWSDDATQTTADSTAISECDTFDTAEGNSTVANLEDKLYSDEYINSAIDEEDDEDDADRGSHEKGTTIEAGQRTGPDDCSTDKTAENNPDSKAKRKKKVFGVSVRHRSIKPTFAAPKSPNCVSQA